MVSKFAYARCKRLAVLVIMGLVSAPAFSGVTAKATMTASSQHEGSVTFECTDVCAVPSAGGAIPIPFPEISASVSNGELRGLARIFGNREAHTVRLNGNISYSTKGEAGLHPGSFETLSRMGMGWIVVGGNSVNSEAGVNVILTSSAHVISNTTAGNISCGEGDTGCSTAAASSSFIMNSAEHGVGSTPLEAGGSTDFYQRTAGGDFFQTASLSMPFSESFEVGWSFDFNLEARQGATAELDFSSTLRFTGIQFMTSTGFDLTPYMEWSFADGLQIPGIQVAAPIPEPETYAMLLAGLGVLALAARRRKIRQASAVTA